MAFAAVQATYKGPYTPGSGLCLIYTMAQEGSEGLMQRVKGGIGRLSECLAEQIEALGGEVRLKQRVSHILVEDNRAVGVALKNGTAISRRYHYFQPGQAGDLQRPTGRPCPGQR